MQQIFLVFWRTW